MIFPISLTIERRVDEESFADNFALEYVLPLPPVYKIIARAIDTETGQWRAYEFHSMVDQTKDPFQNVGVITHSALSSKDLRNLRELRDKIDELLGEFSDA